MHVDPVVDPDHKRLLQQPASQGTHAGVSLAQCDEPWRESLFEGLSHRRFIAIRIEAAIVRVQPQWMC